jgi:hypothetical protein
MLHVVYGVVILGMLSNAMNMMASLLLPDAGDRHYHRRCCAGSRPAPLRSRRMIAGPMEQKGYRLWGKILDGTLSLPVANGVVVTAGERIVWVGEAERLPRELKGDHYADVRLPSRTVMPGLVNGHTHISSGGASLKKQSSSKESATITVAFDRNGPR